MHYITLVQGRINRLETAFVQGNMIRYVHIPDTVNIERDTARHVSLIAFPCHNNYHCLMTINTLLRSKQL